MTPQENQALQTLLSQLTQIRGVVKDPQADAMIANALSRQPDAAYLLVQRVMILEQAVEAAKARIAELEGQLQQGRPQAGSGSFLDANSWGNAGAGAARPERSVTGAELPSYPSGRPYAQNTPPNAQNAAPPYSGAPGYPAAPRPGLFGGGAGSMLGTMAATAAGVAGGAFLFQGLENLLGNHSGHGLADRIAGQDNVPSHLSGDIPAQNAAAFEDLGPSGNAPLDNSAGNDVPADDDLMADSGGQDDLLSDNDFDAGSLDDDGSYDV